MKLRIKIHANSSQEKILKKTEDFYEVWIKEKPVDGNANQKLIKLLKKHFKKDIELKSGIHGRNKIIGLK